jgi:hypothetical protein
LDPSGRKEGGTGENRFINEGFRAVNQIHYNDFKAEIGGGFRTHDTANLKGGSGFG